MSDLIVPVAVALVLVVVAWKLLKIAIVIALIVGGLMLVQNKFGGKRLK